MSQVVVTEDRLKNERLKSKDQEKKIIRDTSFQRFRKNDITGPDVFKSAVGFAVLPIVALWALLVTSLSLMLTGLKYIFQALGSAIGGKK